MTGLTDALLGLATVAVWLGCLGFVRLRRVLDRLHCAAFVTWTAGLPLLLATLASQGASAAVLKVLFLLVAALLSGAALAHAIGHALTWRERQGAEP